MEEVPSLDSLSLSWDPETSTLEVGFAPTPIPPGLSLFVWATEPLNPGVAFVSPKLRLLTVLPQGTTSPADITAQYLALILEAFPEENLLLLWDRAPWHFGQPVRDVLSAHPRLEVMLFPVAAPDLNPQEHVWEQARDAISHNHTARQFQPLIDDFETYLNETVFSTNFMDAFTSLGLGVF